MTRKRNRPAPKLNINLPCLILAIFFGLGVFFLMIKVEPEVVKNVAIPGLYLPFLVLVGLTIFFGLLGLNAYIWRACIWSIAVVLFLILRIFGLGNLLNAGLIFALVLVLEYYLRANKEGNTELETE